MASKAKIKRLRNLEKRAADLQRRLDQLQDKWEKLKDELEDEDVEINYRFGDVLA